MKPLQREILLVIMRLYMNILRLPLMIRSVTQAINWNWLHLCVDAFSLIGQSLQSYGQNETSLGWAVPGFAQLLTIKYIQVWIMDICSVPPIPPYRYRYRYQAEIHTDTDTRLMIHTDTDTAQTFIPIPIPIPILVSVSVWDRYRYRYQVYLHVMCLVLVPYRDWTSSRCRVFWCFVRCPLRFT